MTRLAFVALALCGLLTAQDKKPNFSGNWTLSKEKSDFGMLPMPDKLVRKIKHAEPVLEYTTTATTPKGDQTMDTKYTTDGKESVNKYGGTEVKGVAQWDGTKLVVKYQRTAKAQGQEFTLDITESWELSADGKTMTQINKIGGTPMGELIQKSVFEKAE